MTTSRSLLISVLGVCTLLVANAAPAETIVCPARFPTKSLQFGTTGTDWTAGASGLGAPLESIGLFDGPPSEGAMLKPTTTDGVRVAWDLEPPYRRELWVQCAYGSDSLTLSRPLPNVPKSCVAKYGKDRRYQPRAIEFACR